MKIYEEYAETLKKCALFDGFRDAEIPAILGCVGARMKTVKRNADAFDGGEVRIGILLRGEILNVKYDYYGNQNILARFTPADTFGEAVVCARNTKDAELMLIATEDSAVLLLDYAKILSVCGNACSFHSALIRNMLAVLAEKNVALTHKLEHITKRTTRDKILSYLSERAKTAKSKTFTIPFDRQQLADYLSVERSALSAELSKLAKAGAIFYRKNNFTLL